MNAEDKAYDILVDVDAEGQRNLLRNSRANARSSARTSMSLQEKGGKRTNAIIFWQGGVQ